MKFQSKTLVFAFVFILTAPLVAQEFEAQHYQAKDGLAQGHHGCMLQDFMGHIWSTSQGGLTKFDGKTFEIITYDHTHQQLLEINEQSPIFESKDHMLWIGSFGGLYMYDQLQDTFAFWGIDSNNIRGPAIPQITYITEDKNNILWLATFGGLYSYDRTSNRWVYYDPIPEIAYKRRHHSKKSIRSIIHDKYDDNILWLGGMSKLFKFDISTQSYVQHWEISHQKGLEVSIFAIVQDSPTQFYIGSYGMGLQYFDTKKKHTENLLNESTIIIHDEPFQIIRSIFQLDSVQLMCTNHDESPFVYNTTTKKVKYLDQLNMELRSHSIIKDRDGSFWISNTGITKLNTSYINKFNRSNTDYAILKSAYDSENNCYLVYTSDRRYSLNYYAKKVNKFVTEDLNLIDDVNCFIFDKYSQSFLLVYKDELIKISSKENSQGPVKILDVGPIKNISITENYIYLHQDHVLYKIDRRTLIKTEISINSNNIIDEKHKTKSKFKTFNTGIIYYKTSNQLLKYDGVTQNFSSVLYDPTIIINDFVTIDSLVFVATSTGLKKYTIINDSVTIGDHFINPMKSIELLDLKLQDEIIYMRNHNGLVGFNYLSNQVVLQLGYQEGLSLITDYYLGNNNIYGHGTSDFFLADLK